MTRADASDGENLVFHERRITDATCKEDYERRRAAMKKDKATLAFLMTFVERDSTVGPSMEMLMNAVNKGGWAETSMTPLLLTLLVQKDITRETTERYLNPSSFFGFTSFIDSIA